MKRPNCEMRGTVSHPATKMLGWSLNSGRLWKLSCDKGYALGAAQVPWFLAGS